MPRKKKSMHDRLKSTNPNVMSRALKEFGRAADRIKHHVLVSLGERAQVECSWVGFTFKVEIRLPSIVEGCAPVIVSIAHPDMVFFEAMACSSVDLLQIAAADFLENTDADDFCTSEFAESSIGEYADRARMTAADRRHPPMA